MTCQMLNSQTSSQPFSHSSLQALLSRLQTESDRRHSRNRLAHLLALPKAG